VDLATGGGNMRIGLSLPALGTALLVMSAYGPAAADEKAEVMERIRKLAEDVRSFKAKMTVRTAMMGSTVTWRGEVTVKKPNMYKSVMNMNLGGVPGEQVTISDGRTQWIYQSQMKMVMKLDLKRLEEAGVGEYQKEKAGKDITKPFMGIDRESIRYLGKESLDGREVYVFEGKPKGSFRGLKMGEGGVSPPARVRVWVGAKDGLLYKEVFYNDKGTEMMSVEFEEVHVNVPIGDEEFSFTPPEGTQVVDMTEGTLNILKALKGAEKEGDH